VVTVPIAGRSGYRTLRRETYATLFALLACTGLRVSEAIGLLLDDLTPDGLVSRCSKFRKSRLVPLHETARVGLEHYLNHRLPYAPAEAHVFVSLRRKPLLVSDVESAFRTAARASGLPERPAGARATPHSLRHTFAVRALQACPDARDAITLHMLALSTYLGHAKVADTYWYLEAVPELMGDIAENRAGSGLFSLTGEVSVRGQGNQALKGSSGLSQPKGDVCRISQAWRPLGAPSGLLRA